MTSEELGAALRAEREKRHLTIENVADQLKINPRLLLALESGEGQMLPHPAYARGFIRSYAAFLGFGPAEIQEMLASPAPEGQRKPKSDDAIPAAPAARTRRARGSASWLALLVLCAAAAAAWWAWETGRLDFLKRSHEQPADLLQSLPGADKWLAGKERPKENEPAPEKPQPVIAGLSRPANPIASIPQPAPAEPEQPADVVPQAAEPEQPAAESQPDQHKLVIVAIEECWVHSNADKTDTRQFSLRKGDTFALTFAKSLDLKLGNAGGVRLRYDGRDLPPPGTSGQVRTISLPPKED